MSRPFDAQVADLLDDLETTASDISAALDADTDTPSWIQADDDLARLLGIARGLAAALLAFNAAHNRCPVAELMTGVRRHVGLGLDALEGQR